MVPLLPSCSKPRVPWTDRLSAGRGRPGEVIRAANRGTLRHDRRVIAGSQSRARRSTSTGLLDFDQTMAFRLKNRRKEKKPAMPMPSRAIEAGSGTAVVEMLTEPVH